MLEGRAVCNWVHTNEVRMTHACIGQMLAVRRESVTVVAQRLQAEDVIRYNQGHITIVDRAGLEARVCECYGVVKSEFTRLLG
jgi:CRP-like cAMP-binding protein